MKHYLMDLQGNVYFAETGDRVDNTEMSYLCNHDEELWIGLRIQLQTAARVMNTDILVNFGEWDLKILGDLSDVYFNKFTKDCEEKVAMKEWQSYLKD